jgi:transcriptional regulator with XRE-family HTH domain
MSRFHQRLQQRLRDPEFAVGYQEMDSELQLLSAIDTLRERAHISTEELARRMGRSRPTVSRLFNAAQANPTLDTIMTLLTAMNLTAEVTLRPARSGEQPLKVAIRDKRAG